MNKYSERHRKGDRGKQTEIMKERKSIWEKVIGIQMRQRGSNTCIIENHKE